MSASGWTYKQTEPQLWTVGYYEPNGRWEAESDHGTPGEAVNRVILLNGGKPEPIVEETKVEVDEAEKYTEWALGICRSERTSRDTAATVYGLLAIAKAIQQSGKR